MQNAECRVLDIGFGIEHRDCSAPGARHRTAGTERPAFASGTALAFSIQHSAFSIQHSAFRMGTLFSELAPHAERLTGPRIYADANIPAGVVTFMRDRLRWDVLFVVEHDDLRRLPDTEHFRLARQLHRTLITLDRDYLDDRRFPPAETAGVLVAWAPDERGLTRTLRLVHTHLFLDGSPDAALPLERQKLMVQPGWTGPGPGRC
jgi:hypothetical protein